MARETMKDLPAIIQRELAPIKEQLEAKDKETSRLLNENASLKDQLLEKDRKIEALSKENEQAIGKLRKASLQTDLANKKVKSVVKEARATSAKALLTSRTVKKAAEDTKTAFIENAVNKLEKHINEVSFSAFNSARRLFHKDHNVLSESLMREMARILSPYMSDRDLTSKLGKVQEMAKHLEETNAAIKESYEAKVGDLTKKLKSTYEDLSKVKLTLYKEQLVKSLPHSAQDKVLKEMEKANNVESVKRIYIAALRESARLQASDLDANPVADASKKPSVTSRKPLTEAEKPTPQLPDVQEPDINDPEMLKLAGVED